MKVQDLALTLRNLSRLFESGGATNQSKEMAALAAALEQFSSDDIGEWAANFERDAKKKPKTPRPQEPLDQSLLDAYGQSLRRVASTDDLKIILQGMRLDKSVDKRHLFAIAANYVGASSSFKTQRDAFAGIEEFFVEQQRFSNKLHAAHLD